MSTKAAVNLDPADVRALKRATGKSNPAQALAALINRLTPGDGATAKAAKPKAATKPKAAAKGKTGKSMSKADRAAFADRMAAARAKAAKAKKRAGKKG